MWGLVGGAGLVSNISLRVIYVHFFITRYRIENRKKEEEEEGTP